MKLKRGQARYKIPEHSEVLWVCVEGNQKYNQMAARMIQIVSGVQISNEGLEPAMPRRCAVYRDLIMFCPPPDKPYIVKVRYTPPVMEF